MGDNGAGWIPAMRRAVHGSRYASSRASLRMLRVLIHDSRTGDRSREFNIGIGGGVAAGARAGGVATGAGDGTATGTYFGMGT